MRLFSPPLLTAGIAAGLAGLNAAESVVESGITRNASASANSRFVVRRGLLDMLRGDGGDEELQPVAADTMLVFPTIAYPAKDSRFSLDFHAVAFRHTENPSKRMRGVRRLVQSVFPSDLSQKGKEIFHSRFAPFMSTPAFGSSAVVDLTIEKSRKSVANVRMPKFAPDGHVEVAMELTTVRAGDRIIITAKAVDPGAALPTSNPVACEAEVIVAGEEGFGVISDIDDTIKITNVLSKTRVLEETFFNEFRPTNTMSSLYFYLSRNLKFVTDSYTVSDPVFYYLSASPWQLFTPIMSFLRHVFPRGELLLSKFDSSKPRSLLGLTNVKEYKLTSGLMLLDKFPRRKFILIGDSGQKDPEIYSELYRKRPDQVACILIRRVTGTDAEKEAELNDKTRFDEAMDGVPPKKWVLFDGGFALLDKVDFKKSCGANLGLKPTESEPAEVEEEDEEEGESFLDKIRSAVDT